MKRIVRSLVGTIIAAVIAISCFMVPVSSDTMESFKFDDLLNANRSCNARTQYKLNIEQSALYGIDIIMDVDQLTAIYFPECHIVGQNGEAVTPLDNHTEWPDTGDNNYWHVGDDAKNISTTCCYLEKGEYTFTLDYPLSQGGVFSVSIYGFDGDVYITEDGNRMDIYAAQSTAGINYISGSADHKYELVIEPGSRGQNYKNGNIKVWEGNKSISYGSLTEKLTIPISLDIEYTFHVHKGEWRRSLDYYFKILSTPKNEFTSDTNLNILGDGVNDTHIEFRCTDPKGFQFSNEACKMDLPKNTLSFDLASDHYPDVFLGELKDSDMVATIHYFVKETSNVSELSLDKTCDSIYCGEYGENMSSQYVCSYTPEKDGTYHLTSTGLGKYPYVANPYVAVFDSNDNCIGWYDNNVNATEVGLRKFANSGIDYQLNMIIDLKAGQTYYFYFTNGYSYSRFDYLAFNMKGAFDIKLTEYTEPVAEVPEQGSTTPSSPSTPSTPSTPAVSSDSELSFGDFVERLYVVALNRASEPEGKAFWCEHVGNGDLTGAACANEFLLSKEFKDRGLNDEEFLKVLYKTFFDRDAEADKDGFNFWMNSLKTEGRDKVVDGFINSTEWCNICATYGVKSGATRAKATVASKNAIAFAERLYTKCLGRDAETEGLNFWSLGLTNLELTGSQAAHEFFFSKEFNDHNFDDKELLTRMYRTFMGREPDDDGMNFWLNNMKNGMTKEEVFNEFVKSKEFTEICQSYAINRG